MAILVEGSISTGDLPSLVLDGLFDSFGDETISDDVYIQNFNDVDELNNETDHDRGIICNRYSDASNDKSYSIKPDEDQHTVLTV